MAKLSGSSSRLDATPTAVVPHAGPRLYINGKFYAGKINGVRRVAERLVRELDAIAAEGTSAAGWDMRLLLPERAIVPELQAIRIERQPHGHTQFWEQLLLPFVAWRGTLLSLANLAPGMHPRKVTMVHDAQFRLSPRSYPLKLRLGYRVLIARGARSSALVLTVSDYARDSLAAFNVADPTRTQVIGNGADHILETRSDAAAVSRHGLVPHGYCLVFGSTWQYKNLQVVFEAMKRQRTQKLRLAVIGPAREAFERCGLTAPDGARFLGPIDDHALRALYEHAHCLLFPSRTEGFGLPPAEAMACGCPVVAAPAGAIPEVCRDAVLYAGLDSPAEWAAQIDALRNPSIRETKVALGRARAAGFTWRAAGLRLLEVLTPVVERGARTEHCPDSRPRPARRS